MTSGFETIRGALTAAKGIDAWELRHDHTGGVQVYLLPKGHESERRVDSDEYIVTVHVRHDGVQGSTRLRLMRGEEAEIGARLEQALYMARLGGAEPYELVVASAPPKVELADPALARGVILQSARAIADRWVTAVGQLEGARPSSGELFAEEVTSRLENSAGFVGEVGTTKLSLLNIVLARTGEREAERITWDERRRVVDLDVESIVRASADEARDLTRAELPPSGSLPVVIEAREFGALFSPIVESSSAESIFQRSTRFEIGQPLPGVTAGGDPLLLASNATTPFGLSSYSFDADGLAARRVEVIRDGRFVRPWASQQYASYTKLEPTGAFGNLEIGPGSTPYAELFADGPVLHVVAFSWLTPDRGRGDFSSEIRIGYLVDANGRRPIKGGSVSGNLFAGLSAARFSRETIARGDYFGPRAVRFEGVQVTGA